jgi:hypothetical protein
MALEGASPPKKADFQYVEGYHDPDIWEAQLRTLTLPEEPTAPQPTIEEVTRQIQVENVLSIVRLATNDPSGWMALRAFIREMMVNSQRLCARINPTEDPHASHGRRCELAGRAAGLEMLLERLDVDWLETAISKPGRMRRATGNA